MGNEKPVIRPMFEVNEEGRRLLQRLERGQKLINFLALVAFAVVLLWIFGVF